MYDPRLSSLLRAIKKGRTRYILERWLISTLLMLVAWFGLPLIWGSRFGLGTIVLTFLLFSGASFVGAAWDWRRRDKLAKKLGLYEIEELPI